MNELKPLPCPICGDELKIHGPEDWHPTPHDPDSGGDPYNAVCDCGFQYSNGSYDYAEFIACLNRRAQPAKVVDALTRCLYDNVYDHDYWVNTRDILGIDPDSAASMADEILRGFYMPAPCDECTGTSCADCELKDVCITWDMEE